MAGLGIGLGIFVALLVMSFTGEYISYNFDKGAGIIPGLIAGVWVAWPFFHRAGVARYNFLHPVPKEYKVTAKEAFKKIRNLLAETTYNYGDRWAVATADTLERYIKASLRFTDEESHMDVSSRGDINWRTERVQRFLELEVQLKDTGTGTTKVQFDFHPRVEGMKWYACDQIINGLVARVDADLGPGTDCGKPMDTALQAPPWWLIIAGGVGVLSLAGTVIMAVFG